MDGSPDSLLAYVQDRDIRQVRIAFTDLNGLLRARSVAAAALPSVLQRGVNFSSPTIDFNSRELFPPDAAFDLASADFWARPDPATFRELTAPPQTGIMLADLVDAEGEPWSGCPRTALRRAAARAAEGGLRFNVGFEPEGYLFRPGAGSPEPVGLAEFATADGLDLEAPFMADLLAALETAGITVDQWSEEYGPGQIEINLRHGPALEAADNLVLFKYLFRAAARRYGLVGTFMPKPFGDLAGSGLHVHLSASSLDGEENLFDDLTDVVTGLSTLGRHALGGLLAHGEALTAVGASTVNSYKRFLPGSWAPTSIMYAPSSRAAFVRIPERSTARRLELRSGDPAANPYLYAAAILAAMLDGIAWESESGPPVPGDVGALSPAELAAQGTRPLPRTLGAALDALALDAVIGAALGPVLTAEYIKVKRSEWDAFCAYVGEWDRNWYLSRY